MPLSPGDTLSHYEILAPIGAGGMGEVYKARDTRLDRTVAIKVLPEHIAKREDLKARFEREARAVASLNHPHICVLFDIGEQQGTSFMVLEHLEGETIESRLQRGALPLDTALQYAMQTADALDRAHRAGVTHRDIKPANLMLTRDGVKVLDFGLAKSTAKPGPTEATIVASLTSEGTVLGTPQYMAPEQFEGKEADPRADVWAFGAVLYEMLSGQKAFQGKNYSSLVGAILSTDPAPVAPAWLERIVRRCLQKDPEDRYQSIRDVVLDLRALPGPAETSAKTRAARPWLAWGIAAVATVAALILGAFHLRQPEVPVITTSIHPPEKASFQHIAISPDGKVLAFTATADTRRQLYLRPMHSQEAQPRAGTEGAEYPFWSPDSRFIGFFAQGKLKKIEAAGGPAQNLCDVLNPRGGAWNEEGVILFADFQQGLVRTTSQGGTPIPLRLLEKAKGENNDRWPVFLPGGQAFLHTVTGSDSGFSGTYIGQLDGGKHTRLLTDRSSFAIMRDRRGVYHLLFLRDGTLMAQPLDVGRGASLGEAFSLGAQVGVDPRGWGSFTASTAGLLVYHSSSGDVGRQMTWVDRSGTRLGTLGSPGPVSRPALSPDEKSVAFELAPADHSGESDIWLHDVGRNVSTRFTFGRQSKIYSVWSPDGRSIAYATRDGHHLYRKSSTGAGTEELLVQSSQPKFTVDWSAAAGAILYTVRDPKNSLDVWSLPMPAGKPVPVLTTEFNEQSAAFSPDGKFLAYLSDESGRTEVYVQTYPLSGAKWQVSSNGGRSPRWSRDGKELFFLDYSGMMMAVEVTTGSGFRAGTPTRLFPTGLTSGLDRFSVTADGKRFLLALPVGAQQERSATLVQNALEQLRK